MSFKRPNCTVTMGGEAQEWYTSWTYSCLEWVVDFECARTGPGQQQWSGGMLAHRSHSDDVDSVMQRHGWGLPASGNVGEFMNESWWGREVGREATG